MAWRRKMDSECKAFINSLLEHYQPKDAQDTRTIFPPDDSLFKMPYLAMMDATKNGLERLGTGI